MFQSCCSKRSEGTTLESSEYVIGPVNGVGRRLGLIKTTLLLIYTSSFLNLCSDKNIGSLYRTWALWDCELLIYSRPGRGDEFGFLPPWRDQARIQHANINTKQANPSEAKPVLVNPLKRNCAIHHFLDRGLFPIHQTESPQANRGRQIQPAFNQMSFSITHHATFYPSSSARAPRPEPETPPYDS